MKYGLIVLALMSVCCIKPSAHNSYGDPSDIDMAFATQFNKLFSELLKVHSDAVLVLTEPVVFRGEPVQQLEITAVVFRREHVQQLKIIAVTQPKRNKQKKQKQKYYNNNKNNNRTDRQKHTQTNMRVHQPQERGHRR